MAESAMSSTNVASLRRHFAGDERTRFEVIKPPYQQTSNRRLTSESNNDRRVRFSVNSLRCFYFESNYNNFKVPKNDMNVS